jgi:hypothetical protein
MSKLMWIAGILLIAIGIALGLMVFASPTSVVGWGINPEVASILVVGGVLALGLGGVVNSLERMASRPAETAAYSAPVTPIPEFGRKAVEQVAPAAAVGAATAAVADDVSEPVKETIAALEQARQKIEQAFEPPAEERPAAATVEPVAEPANAPVNVPAPDPETQQQEAAEEADVTEEEVVAEGQLYVVEERFIRQRPARILSDGTVEAETDEGWMRFENLEHLDEYLDAMAPASRA